MSDRQVAVLLEMIARCLERTALDIDNGALENHDISPALRDVAGNVREFQAAAAKAFREAA